MRHPHEEQRVLLTFGKEVGTLTFRETMRPPAGIVLFRLPPRSKADLMRFVVEALQTRTDWAGHFAVIEQHRMRMRPLPNL